MLVAFSLKLQIVSSCICQIACKLRRKATNIWRSYSNGHRCVLIVISLILFSTYGTTRLSKIFFGLQKRRNGTTLGTKSTYGTGIISHIFLLGGPGKNKMKIIHETDNGVINNHISNHEISQRSTDRRRRQFSDLSPMPSFHPCHPWQEYHILKCANH